MTSLMLGERHGPNTICEHLWVSGQIVGGDDHEIADNAGPIFCSSAEEVLTDSTVSALQREKPFQSHPETSEWERDAS